MFFFLNFSDIIPPRIPVLPILPHVRSDPALSVNLALRHQQYQQLDCNGRKLVQVSSKKDLSLKKEKIEGHWFFFVGLSP